jgi:hypothetical protein
VGKSDGNLFATGKEYAFPKMGWRETACFCYPLITKVPGGRREGNGSEANFFAGELTSSPTPMVAMWY